MKISRLVLAVGLSFGLMLPVSAMAQPVPPECQAGHGRIKCDKPGCKKFCKQGPSHKGHGKHAKPGHPVPPPHAKRKLELEDRLNSLIAHNKRLMNDRNEALREADHAYGMCMRMHPAVRSHCVRSTGKADSIGRQIERNAVEIEQIRRELRRF